MNRRRTVPLLLIFGICLALPLPAAADWTDAGGVSCRYVESGAPGPAGNRLRIDLDAGIEKEFQKPGEAAVGSQVERGGSGGRGEAGIGAAFEQKRGELFVVGDDGVVEGG